MSIPTDQYELYAEFGFTAEKAQVLETEAGNVALSFLALFVNTNEITPEATEMFRSVVNDVNRKTFGALLKRIKAVVTFDPSIVQIIDEALERRNHLTHHFFRTHNFAIFDTAGRKAMVEELKEIQSKLDLAHASLLALSSAFEAFAGRGGVSASKKLLTNNQGPKLNPEPSNESGKAYEPRYRPLTPEEMVEFEQEWLELIGSGAIKLPGEA
jgi:hypothetical protein